MNTHIVVNEYEQEIPVWDEGNKKIPKPLNILTNCFGAIKQ